MVGTQAGDREAFLAHRNYATCLAILMRGSSLRESSVRGSLSQRAT